MQVLEIDHLYVFVSYRMQESDDLVEGEPDIDVAVEGSIETVIRNKCSEILNEPDSGRGFVLQWI